jgi:hypothetical protein
LNGKRIVRGYVQRIETTANRNYYSFEVMKGMYNQLLRKRKREERLFRYKYILILIGVVVFLVLAWLKLGK